MHAFINVILITIKHILLRLYGNFERGLKFKGKSHVILQSWNYSIKDIRHCALRICTQCLTSVACIWLITTFQLLYIYIYNLRLILENICCTAWKVSLQGALTDNFPFFLPISQAYCRVPHFSWNSCGYCDKYMYVI